MHIILKLQKIWLFLELYKLQIFMLQIKLALIKKNALLLKAKNMINGIYVQKILKKENHGCVLSEKHKEIHVELN